MTDAKSNGATPKQVQLTEEERVKVALVNLKREHIHLLAKTQLEEIEKETQALRRTINDRLGGGVDISKYRVDCDTGLATLPDEGAAPQILPPPRNADSTPS